MAWSPIDTADDTTKDGHDLLVALEPGGRQLVARWQSDLRQWVACDDRPVTPTHFQELGPAPTPVTPAVEAAAKKPVIVPVKPKES